MPSLKDLKLRIESVKSTRKITKAMQMVAAAKLRRAQNAAVSARPYSQHMRAVVANLARAAAGAESAPRVLTGTGSDKSHLLIVATAERGLCGSFNSSIVKLARIRARELIADGKTVRMLTIGRKGREQLQREFESRLVGHVDLSGMKSIEYRRIKEVAADILNSYDQGEFDQATLFYSRFKTVITQIPTAMQLIPIPVGEEDDDESAGGVFYEFEPDEQELLIELLPRAITNQVYSALLENAASEQGARMSAMDNATRNAGEMIDKLTIVYNRSRQAAITKELIEIISGAEAL
ncbi:MAG: F0F1 ATP synthase subunit gamma [Rhodobacteraceae bacterium]|nr:F0F1 ATP synthase subunit gamma [Paracoccaceae bacterium]